ncbi:hypothetical protein [Streptomyces sp. ISL-100]|uniref:hypothetical protein n=1 Tax=Streptomyces sp. ISL-100 TaxID=2819173 RepID=UPI001BE8B572|nr:hypothetical protein [Streptomyces sp. ISL-100]MBT2399366.1 hypothetical protein [Streptomyces sp. ISL-100]
MTSTTVCTCRPGATLWLDGAPRHAVAEELADRLRAAHHRRVEVLDPATSAVPGESPRAAAERIGLVAEILARHGILAVVAAPEGPPADRNRVRDRHLRAGTTFLEVRGAGPDDPAPSVDVLLALLAEHGLVLAG